MIKVLFVCAGNICRSPMADAVFADRVQKAGLSDQISVDSAGVGAWHVGEQADRRTLATLRQHGIDGYNGRSRQIKTADLSTFDYVLTMDSSNARGVERLGNGPAEVAMFLSYANAAGTVSTKEVPDPYYNDRFEAVYDLVMAGSEALLAHIREQHGL